MPDDYMLKGINLSYEQALLMLKYDLDKVCDQVNSVLKVDLPQNRFDAICSLVFNIGIGNFKRSKALTYLNEENYTSAAEEMFSREKGFNFCNGKFLEGLFNRRQDELKRWML